MGKTHYLFLLVFLLLVSCEKEGLNEPMGEVGSSTETEKYHFKYKGACYLYDPEIVNESSELLDSLTENQGVALFVHESGLAEYFDNYDELIENLENGNIDNPIFTRSGVRYFKTHVAELRVYSEFSFVGDYNSWILYASSPLVRKHNVVLSNMSPNLDQRISSMEIRCQYEERIDNFCYHVARPYVTFFDTANPEPKGPVIYNSLTFGVYLYKPPYGYVHKFSKFKKPGGTWNDAPRALSFFLSGIEPPNCN